MLKVLLQSGQMLNMCPACYVSILVVTFCTCFPFPTLPTLGLYTTRPPDCEELDLVANSLSSFSRFELLTILISSDVDVGASAPDLFVSEASEDSKFAFEGGGGALLSSTLSVYSAAILAATKGCTENEKVLSV